MKKRILSVYVAFFILLILLPAIHLISKSPDLNVLLITIDTWRYDRLGIHDHGLVKTPHLDKMAAQGANFRRAFAHNPTTLASHANILTGATPLYHGVSDNDGFKLHGTFLTMAEHLKTYDYSTAAFVGSAVLSQAVGLDQGFDLYVEPTESPDFIAGQVIKNTLRWMKAQQKKWFCWVHLWDPHSPYSPPSPFDEQYRNDPYSGEVAYVDAQLGKLFGSMADRNLLQRSLVIITGDHGEAFGEHGEFEHGIFAYNTTIHIPLILWGKPIFQSAIKDYVSHVDIFPTVCDSLGIPHPDQLQGESLLPLLKKRRKMRNSPIYFESKGFYYHRGWAPLEGLISEREKFISLPIPELYDLDRDFSEAKNVFSEKNASALKKKLSDLKKDLALDSKDLAKRRLSHREIQLLRSFGYLAGYKQKSKQRFTRDDDPKVLLPLQIKLERAKELLRESRLDQAVSLGSEIIKERSDFVGAYILLAQLYHRLNQPDKAISILEKGLAESPDNLEIKAELGISLSETEHLERSIALLLDVVSVDEHDSVVWNSLGLACWKSGDFEKALSAYRKALEIDPENAWIYGNIGNLYLTSQKYNLAEENFAKALELNPDLAQAYNGMGAVCFQRGKYQEAEKNFSKSIDLSPSNYLAHYNLFILYARKLNQSDKALGIYRIIKDKFYSDLSPHDRDEIERIMAELGRE